MNYILYFILFECTVELTYWDTLSKKSSNKSFSTFSDLLDIHYTIESINQTNGSLFIDLYSNHSFLQSNYTLEINFITYDIVQFIFREANSTRFELPKAEPFPYHKTKLGIYTFPQLKYQIVLTKNPFSLEIRRRATNETIFRTPRFLSFFFMKNFCHITTLIPTENLFGLGQRTSSFKIHTGIYTFYNKDNPSKLDFGIGHNNNKYGSHPMYLMKEKSGNYFISYLRNSFPMDIKVTIEKKEISYFIAGGVLDFSLFLGDKNPENVIKMYHKFLGGWIMPPFWSLGFHQSRWGYKNLTTLYYLLYQYNKSEIPMDSLWLDIDYMNQSHPCTWNDKKFDSEKFKKLFQRYNKKYVVLSEPVIGIKTLDLVYEGRNMSVFIKDPSGNKFLLNKMWPGKCFFIDYFHPNATQYTTNCHDYLYEKSNYSGIWIDMNEIAAFSDGSIDKNENEIPCQADKFPYYPGGYLFEHKTICPNSIHYNNLTNLEVHNYYSSQQSRIMYRYLEEKFPNEYPFLLSRGNSPGIGRYSFLWSGDNKSNYTWYYYSISEVFSMNLFGIPMSGADVCGFAGATNEKLCSKWYQVGSLYPFFRSHRHHDFSDNDPFSMGKILYVTAKNSIRFRYKILKYYYSIFMSLNHTGTIFRPLFLEFYNDNQTLSEYVLNSHFLIGSDLLCIPNINYLNKSSLVGYFPLGNDWYNLKTYKKEKQNGYQIIKIPLNKSLNTYLRGGRMIYMNNIKGVKGSLDLDNIFTIILSYKHYYDFLFFSNGEIPAVYNYHNKNSIEKCIKENCMIQLNSVFDMKENLLTIKITKPKTYSDDFHFLTIKKFIFLFPFKITLYGIQSAELYDITKNIKHKLGIKQNVTLSENSFKISFDELIGIRRKNEYLLQVKIGNPNCKNKYNM